MLVLSTIKMSMIDPQKKEANPGACKGLAVRDRYKIPVMLHIFTTSSSLDDDKETNI